MIKRIMNKKAALEMSVGTIVIIVIAVTMLILGIVLVRNIMCSAMVLTDQVTDNAKKEIGALFGEQSYGVRCQGEEGLPLKLGTGGKRPIACIIKVDEDKTYDISVSIESLSGASDNTVEKWVVDEGWKGSVSPGQDKTAVVTMLNIPRDAESTELKLTITVKDDAGTDTIISYVDISPSGAFRTAFC